MNNWIIVPVVLPALTACFLIVALRDHLGRQRIASICSTAALLAAATGLYALATDGEPRPYLLGDWPAPFGIVLVLDRLSALMVLLTSGLALLVVLYASAGWDEKGRHFHALFHFQLLGINGAFLTGDIFNLFVFFEVLLIASYGLMLHGGGPARLKAGFQYVAINLIASTVFLFAVGLIYAVTGTLNMADLAIKVARVGDGNVALLRTGALLLFGVFAVKAALVPLHWWLPMTYAAAPAPAAALFAIMTKVGAYAILRIYTLIFGPEAGPLADAAAPLVLPAAVVTLAIGTIGVLASRTLVELVCYSVVASMGTLLIAVGVSDAVSLSAALYYVVHSTLAAASLFLIADLVVERRGRFLGRLVPSPPFRHEQLLAGLFLLAALSTVGMPPLSGFIGKLLILDATRTSSQFAGIWWTILLTSLLLIVGFARAGSILFWKRTEGRLAGVKPAGSLAMRITAVAVILGLTAALTVFAGPVMDEMNHTVNQLLEPARYVRAVLGTQTAEMDSGG
jgi:multicomponent K+:H+ antiporter subunit D